MHLSLNALPLPLRLRTETPLTDDELLSFCAENDPLRVERDANGEIVIMTPTGNRTGKINMRLSRLLDEWAEADGRGVAFDSSTGFRLPSGEVRSPDAAWVLKKRWEILTEQEQQGFGPICPDFVIEIVSPSDRLQDLKNKMEQVWLQNGCLLGWLVDIQSRSITIFRSGDQPEQRLDPSSVQGEGPIRGFELVLSRLWD